MLTRAGNRLVASSSRSLLVPLSRPISTIAPALERHAGTRRSLRRDDTSHRYRSRPPSRFSPGPSLDYPDYEPGEPIGGRVIPSRPVVIPPDPDGVLQDSHAARELLAHDTLVIVRQIEMLNIFVGFEQANRYAIQTTEGELVGFLVEEEQSIVSTMTRQFLRTHRPFRAIIMDRHGNPILWIRRPFQFINSRIYVRAAGEENGPLVGEAQQEWHPWRRRYNVFQTRRGGETFSQFARIDGGFWAWDFWLKNKDDQLVASINRNFRGLGRELFTDTGQYVIRFDAAGTELDMPPGAAFEVQGQKLILPSGPDGSLTMDQRAMTLATAVSIDFDYFSRHSGAGGMGFPFMMWGGGDGSADMQRGGTAAGGAASDAGGVGAAAGVGTASGMLNGQQGGNMTEDEMIYGRQPGQMSEQDAEGQEWPYGDESMQPRNDEGGWYPDEEQPMEDPWASEESSGFWGDGDGGGGGDWGGGGGDSW